jgi:hypothetical protein
MDWLRWVAAVAGGIAGLVSLSWYLKARNKGHLFTAVCFLFMSAVFFYLIFTRP